MSGNKTKPTQASVAGYFKAIADEARRKDCEALAKLMTRAAKDPPRMWGTSIVGFGSQHYKYESGREGDTCLVGFAARKADISVYGLGGSLENEALATRLGKYKMGKGCLYIRRLGDVDLKILEQLVVASVKKKSQVDAPDRKKDTQSE